MGRWSDVRYAAARDGVFLAFQEAGSGPPLLLLLDGFVAIEDMDDEPRLATVLQRLSRSGRVIRFDRRGIGLSDPSLNDAAPTLEQWVDDAEAVLDAAGVDRAIVLGERGGALIAIALAALRPRRVRSLVLVNAYAKFMACDDHPHGVDPGFQAMIRERLFDPAHPDGPFDIVAYLAPSAADDVRFRTWWDRAGRRGASPTTARRLREVLEALDVRELLPLVEADTLVIHRAQAAVPRVEQGQLIAERIPRARFAEVDGPDAVWYVGDTDRLVDEIVGFVDVEVSSAERNETLTVLMADIVDSTAHAASLGDQSWTRTFDAYEAVAHRSVERYGGEYVKSTGDGSLATFDGPVRAVEAATELRRGAAGLGVQVRIGVHTGRVERRGRDIAGIAIHVTSRVMSTASADEILITGTTADLLTGTGIQLHPRGEHDLRGIPGRWSLLSVNTPDSAPHA